METRHGKERRFTVAFRVPYNMYEKVATMADERECKLSVVMRELVHLGLEAFEKTEQKTNAIET